MVIRPLEVRGSRGCAHSIARPCVPISFTLTHMVYLLPYLSYLAGSKGVSARPSDPDTMTNTVLEAIASSSGNIVLLDAEHKDISASCSIVRTVV